MGAAAVLPLRARATMASGVCPRGQHASTSAHSRQAVLLPRHSDSELRSSETVFVALSNAASHAGRRPHRDRIRLRVDLIRPEDSRDGRHSDDQDWERSSEPSKQA